MLRWPEAPSVYGWLRLDRRGNWRVRAEAKGQARFESIGNAALREFIARNYDADPRGCWYFQNGPQRVFVSLDYAPLVYRAQGDTFADHCGRTVERFDAAWLDEEGSLVLQSPLGVGLLDDRDLGVLAERLARGYFVTGNQRLRLGRLGRAGLEAQFFFVREPRA